ncbi:MULTISPECIES: tetratricopeptide repeat protein [unclassified Streptomyces]|uniref:Tetratricopeptide repeat protein n=1 Tax=Streptomyces sp. NBC_00060 TaxID=2975636 RepID=A0AAU2H7C0_9ACTN
MFSRRHRRPKSAELLKAWECLDAGDIPGAVRLLRTAGEDLPLGEVALVAGRAAKAAGFDDLDRAAAAVAARPGDDRALYDFGYACIERGLSFLAVPALREVLTRNPGALQVMRELVAAYESENRHGEAVELLARHESGFEEWPDRYLLVFNAIMAGELALAKRQYALLPEPEDPMWLPAHQRQRHMLERAASAGPVSALDRTDLRGWQFVTGGTVLGALSPFGFGAGMNGRYAWLQDSHGECLQGLLRLKALLDAAGVRPCSVSLLPDRGSRILGLAAAELLGLPAEPFAPGREDTVVIAYDLNELAAVDEGPEILGQLHGRVPGQVLHEHASSWTDPPVITADSVALLHQAVVAPWDGQLRAGEGGEVERAGADERPDALIAAEIVGADPSPDEGDGETPADPDERFTEFVTAVRGSWLRGERTGLKSTGPVPSSKFA